MRVRCGPTKNRDRCHCSSPRAVEASFLRKVLFEEETSKREMESDTGEGTFGSFEVKTGRGTHKFGVKSVAVYIQKRPPGRIRQRQLPQKNLDNLGVGQRRVGLVRNGSKGRWSWVERNRGATGKG